MPFLHLLHTRTFDGAMDWLRMECFPGNYPTGSAKDEFDDRSIHIVARADDKLAGYGRLIPGPDAYFEATFRKHAVIPTGSDVVDFGRVMVAPAHRGHDLFELILVEGLILATDLSFRCVVGALRPERGFRPLIHDLGFVDSGPPLPQHFPNGVVQPHLRQRHAEDLGPRLERRRQRSN
jgi:predicted GNAT family N-acyltransferase